MRPRPDPTVRYALPGHYAMPRPPNLATLARAAVVGFSLALVGGVLGIGLGSHWGLPLVSLGCLVVLGGCLVFHLRNRAFWIWLGRPKVPLGATWPLVLTSIGAGAILVALVVEVAIALGVLR